MRHQYQCWYRPPPLRLLLLSIVVLLVPAFSARAGSNEVQFPCRQIWTADAQRVLGARAEPFQFSRETCVIKLGEHFPIQILSDPVRQFRATLAKLRRDPKNTRVTRVQLGDEGYAVDHPRVDVLLFRVGKTMYRVMVARNLIKLSAAKRLAIAKSVVRKARGAPSPEIS